MSDEIRQVESRQVRLRLTTKKEVLTALRRRRALKTDAAGERYIIQFDSQAFEFRPGTTIITNKSVADSLIKSSGVIVDDDLTGPIEPALERVSEFDLGKEPEEQRSLTVCPVCHKDKHSLKALSRHLQDAHVKDRPDLYVEPSRDKIDWEADVTDDAVNANA